MTDDKLRDEIWSVFGERLEARGVEKDKFLVSHSLPDNQEVAKGSGYLEFIGKYKKHFVCLSIVAWGGVTGFSTIVNLPEDWQKFKIHFPTSYETVVELGEAVKGFNIEFNQDVADRGGEVPNYYAYNPSWGDSRDTYTDDLTASGNGIPPESVEGLILVPASGIVIHPPSISSEEHVSIGGKIVKS